MNQATLCFFLKEHESVLNYLAIEASTGKASVALSAGHEVWSEEQASLRQHALSLLPMVQRLLALGEMQIADIDAIVFGRGPGSFTGLRIASALAKGLAFAHDLPMYAVSGLAAIACEVFQMSPPIDSDYHVLAALDARMQEVYWGCFTPSLCLVSEEAVGFAADIRLPTEMPLIVAGVGIETYTNQWPESWRARILTERVVYPHAKAMIHLVQSGQIEAVNVAQAAPVYIRNPYGEACG